MKYTAPLKCVFNPTNKTINFALTPGFVWSTLFAIVNLTAKQSIYAVGITGYGGAFSGTTLTLDYSTVGMGVNDTLQFILDEGNDSANDLLTAALGVGVNTRNLLIEDLVRQMLSEQRLTNILLANIANIQDDLDDMRESLNQGDL
jgi:hypothetical protein